MRRWRRFCGNRGALAGLAFLVALVLAAIVVPLVAPRDPWATVARPFLPPTPGFPFGTDMLGRDILTGVIYGAKVSLLIGVAAALLSTLLGLLLGAAAAYHGAWIDDVLMRVTEFFQIVPGFVLALVLVAIFQPSLATVIAAIGIVSWPTMARLVRAEFLTLKQREFVIAEHAIGAGDVRVIFRTILPNALSIVIVYGSLLVATSILFESSLSFLGLGDPNFMSWGYMIGQSRSVLRLAWWMPTFPGLAILLTVLSINLVGDGIDEALNPRLREDRRPGRWPFARGRAAAAAREAPRDAAAAGGADLAGSEPA